MQIIATSDEANPYFLISIALGVVILQWFLFSMFRREAVKRDLYERGCRARHIWWTVCTFWAPYLDSTPFRVTYVDPLGAVHKACCWVGHRLLDSPFGHRRVTWVKDKIISQPPPEVWVDDEVIRPKLDERDFSSETARLLEGPDQN
jgi:hypothetical protein